jgi:DNA gyrase subunit A
MGGHSILLKKGNFLDITMEEKKDQKETEIQETQEQIIPRVIEDEMKQSYVDYAMSVIVGRALPDVRDGLKPVHRRILYAMYDMGLFHNKAFKKSATVVGSVLGKFHPHGDMAVYDALVRMTQSFSLRYPLVRGQGNFGSIDGDSAAAYRYTEVKLKKLTEEIIQDIDKETVKFVDNFDGSLKEPSVLPCKVPNLLVNGSSGIAVGMATNVPPHNMGEICDGIIAQIDHPEITVMDLLQYIKGPDFPTGGKICGRNGIRNAYASGRGKLTVRAKIGIEEKDGNQNIIISEIPYMVNKAEMVKEIAGLVKEKKIRGISDIRDESDKDGIRVVIELRSDTHNQIVLNQLYKHTRVQTTFGVIMLALVDGEPHILNLKQLLQYYIEHRKDVIKKRTEFDLKKAEEKAHLLAGIIIALDNIDEVIKFIKNAKLVSDARTALMHHFKLTEKQATAILETRLQRLTSLEQEKVKKEREDLLKLIEELKSILASEKRIFDIIKKELHELKMSYADKRRTEIINEETTELNLEDLIKPSEMIITVTHAGYIKRLPIHTYKIQKRGGKGIVGAGKKEEDFIEDLFIANTHSYLLFFTNKGKVHWLKVYYIPEASRQAKGKAIVNLLHLEKDERITAFVPVKEFDDQHYIVMVTKKGIIKKTDLEEFSNPRKTGIIACTLRENDELINAVLTDGNKNVVIATKKGMAVRFKENKVRAMGRTAAGVRGITLRDDDVVSMVVADDGATLLTVTENGYGKRSNLSAYRETNRGGVGVKNIICSERNGNVVSVKSVIDQDDLMFISKNGIIIRTAATGISVIGRNTQGVRLMKLDNGDKLVAAAKVIRENGE